MKSDELVIRINKCPPGNKGWREFEDICIETLTYLFVPPLLPPRIQTRTLSGVDRRDAVFPNRNFDLSNNWGKLFNEW